MTEVVRGHLGLLFSARGFRLARRQRVPSPTAFAAATLYAGVGIGLVVGYALLTRWGSRFSMPVLW
ncbi:hypothetical protein BWI15_13650 [Kribbella sp. ALI-6-A]|nr:hypothetical protein BWI15_13650 [Kribbella sp. ALI-6-A]